MNGIPTDITNWLEHRSSAVDVLCMSRPEGRSSTVRNADEDRHVDNIFRAVYTVSM